MNAYIIRRVLSMIPTLIGASLLVFLVMRVVPGDIIFALLTDEEGGATQLSEESLAKLRAQLGIDKPLHMQYLTWLAGIPTGDLGDSLWNRQPVSDEIVGRLPISFQLGLMTALLGFTMGLPLGVVSALKRGSMTDAVARFTSIIFLAIPNFWLGLMIIMFTTRQFGWMPPLGYNLLWENPSENLQQMIFPAMVVATSLMAIVARMTRSTVLEVLREDYIRTARAKGLAESTVIIRHVLKVSMIPVITIVSLSLGGLLAGTVVMERVFTIPGLGLYMLESIQVRDYTATQALVFFFAMIFVVINLIVDLTYGWLDPRITYR
ncbi:MAG: ABC transporter permease [Chloroflexota bacterium]|nr:ABC transporter permease [Chloroflexota bacterium]